MNPAIKRRQFVVRTGTRRLPISSAIRERRKLQPFIDPDIGKHRDREYGIVAPYECHSAARDHTWRYLPDKICNRYGRLVDSTMLDAVRAFQGLPKREHHPDRIIRPKWDVIRPRNWWHKAVEENPFIPTCADWYTSPTGVAGNTGAVGSPWNLRKGLTGGGGSIAAGDTLYLRAGTYYGGFTSSFSGTALNPFKVKPYSSGGVTEQYTIEQYMYGTLTQNLPVVAISSISRAGNVVTVTVPSGHGFVSGQVVAIRGVPNGASTSFNGEFPLTSTGSTSLVYSETKDNDSSSGGFASGASVTISLTQGTIEDIWASLGGGEIVINGDAGLGNKTPTTPASTNKGESIAIFGTSGSGSTGTITSLQRGWNGSGWNGGVNEIGYYQSSGSPFWTTVNGVTVTGDHQQWWGSHATVQPWLLSRVQCGNPTRTFPLDISGNGTGPVWARCRAAFTASGVAGLEVIGLCIKDSNDGIFIGGAGGGHNVSALLAYNNGHVDEVRGHGQPCYIHSETSANFIDIISFSNFGSGSKFFASPGTTVRNCVATRVHSFNNMAPSSYTGNPITVDVMPSNKYVEGNWFMGAYDTMEDCAMYDSVAWMPYDSIEKFPNVQFGFGGVCSDFVIDNNWFIGGDQGLHMTNLSNLTFTRNLMFQHTTGSSGVNTQSNSNFHLDDTAAHFATWTWGTGGNINSFWDNNRWIGSDTHSYSFLVSKDGTAGTNEFGSTGFQRYDVPADSRDFLGYTGFSLDYHESTDGGTTLVVPSTPAGFMFRTTPCADIPDRSHIPVWKCDGTSIGTFNLPAAELTACGLTTGDDAIIINALDYFAGVAGGANKITVTNWDGNAVSIAAGSFTRENPIGFTTEDWRGNTWTLGYGELIVYKTAAGAGTAPAITSITPSSGAQGTAPSITIVGTDFVVGATTVSVSGSGVTVSGTTVTGTTSIAVTLTIDGAATLGARTVTVTTTEGSDTDTFTVNAAPATPLLMGQVLT